MIIDKSLNDNIPPYILNSNFHSFHYFFNQLIDKLDSLEKKYPITYKGLLKKLKNFHFNVFNETMGFLA